MGKALPPTNSLARILELRINRYPKDEECRNLVAPAPVRALPARRTCKKLRSGSGVSDSNWDGIIAKRAGAPYRPGDDHSTVKIKPGENDG
jgi:hypothetical protein